MNVRLYIFIYTFNKYYEIYHKEGSVDLIVYDYMNYFFVLMFL